MSKRKKNTSKKKSSNPERVQPALEFTGLGFDDYIGARTLLIDGQPLQGAVLAATAVEKYIKAFGAMRGNVLEGHLQKAHINFLRNYQPKLYAALNPEFFPFLDRCYELRYTDSLSDGFNIAIHSREVLAALDETVLRFEWQMKFTREPQGEPVLTSYKAAIRDRSPRLFRENYLLLRQPRGKVLRGHNLGYAMLNRGGDEGILAYHAVVPCPTDGHFERSGLKCESQEHRIYDFGEAFGEEAMRLARITAGARSVRSFYFGATQPGSFPQRALMKLAFHQGDDAIYFLSPSTCIHLRKSFESALGEQQFRVQHDARPDFYENQPEITEADWNAAPDRQVIGCPIYGFEDAVFLHLMFDANRHEKVDLHPMLLPVMLKYLREIIDALGIVEPTWNENGQALE
jgi:hypothetical protein